MFALIWISEPTAEVLAPFFFGNVCCYAPALDAFQTLPVLVNRDLFLNSPHQGFPIVGVCLDRILGWWINQIRVHCLQQESFHGLLPLVPVRTSPTHTSPTCTLPFTNTRKHQVL